MEDPLYASDGGQSDRHGIHQPHRIFKHSVVPIIITCRQNNGRQVDHNFIQSVNRFFAHIYCLGNVEER